jgi:hypothetical protein
MGAEDLRKLVVQSVFGGDHLLANPEHFRDALLREWGAIDADGTTDGAIQRISPDGRTARIHLRPCKAVGIDVGELADALLAQPAKAGSRRRFDEVWQLVVGWAGEGRIPLPVDDLCGLSRAEGLPHHSAGYGIAAYRVINDLTEPCIAERLRCWGIVTA